MSGMFIYKVNQFPLFSFQVHLYLSGSSYKCEMKPPNLDNWSCIYLLKTCKSYSLCLSWSVRHTAELWSWVSKWHAYCGVQLQWKPCGGGENILVIQYPGRGN